MANNKVKSLPIPSTSASAVAEAAAQEQAKPAPFSKTENDITRAEFLEHAKPLTFTAPDGQTLVFKPREFSTGSYGYRNNDKIRVQINGKEIVLQVGANVMVIGSKNQPK